MKEERFYVTADHPILKRSDKIVSRLELVSYMHELKAEYRKIISRLRNVHGYNIPAPKLNKKEPNKNLYELIENGHKTNGGLKQVNIPCPICGSFYQRNGECNICQK